MTSVLERSLGIIELLSGESEGLSIGVLAQNLNAPPSAVHRLAAELVRSGYLMQDGPKGNYALTMKLPAMGLTYLARNGVVDIAQPVLDRLAQVSGELVRLSVHDGRMLVWVAVAQGATSGLRYDPSAEQGAVAHLASTASGRGFLSSLDDEAALRRVVEQQSTLPTPQDAQFKATEFLAMLQETRQRGYAIAANSFIPGMTAIAAPIRTHPADPAIGALSIAGPAARLSAERIDSLVNPLLEAAAEIARGSRGSGFFRLSKMGSYQ